MKMAFIKERKLNSSTKAAILSGIIVPVLLGVSRIISVNLQYNLSQSTIDDFTRSQSQELNTFSGIQTRLIEENTKINPVW